MSSSHRNESHCALATHLKIKFTFANRPIVRNADSVQKMFNFLPLLSTLDKSGTGYFSLVKMQILVSYCQNKT